MSVDEKMTAIADAIRRYTGKSDKLSLEGMATGVSAVFGAGNQDGYNIGYNEGLSEGRTQGYGLGFEEGKQAEYDALWDVMQRNGGGANYIYAFAYNRFYTDEKDLYNPKHDIVISESVTNAGTYLYAYATKITDTKVNIYANKHSINGMFTDASGLKYIRKLVMQASTVIGTTTFRNCTELVELNMEGVIGQNGLNLQWSTKLNKASIESVINTLSSTTSGLTVTFSKTAVNNAFGIDVDDASTYPEGSEYYNLRNSKSNWTFNYA